MLCLLRHKKIDGHSWHEDAVRAPNPGTADFAAVGSHLPNRELKGTFRLVPPMAAGVSVNFSLPNTT